MGPQAYLTIIPSPTAAVTVNPSLIGAEALRLREGQAGRAPRTFTLKRLPGFGPGVA
jgi:hypothetical protein